MRWLAALLALPLCVVSPARADNAAPLQLGVELVLLTDSGWTRDAASAAARTARHILAQCDLEAQFELREIAVPDPLLDFHLASARQLLERTAPQRPAVFLVRHSLRRTPFDGEAFGRANTRTRPWLADTLWMVADARDPGIVLAHELVHILTNSGVHSTLPGNLMRDETSPDGTLLTDAQCSAIRKSNNIKAG